MAVAVAVAVDTGTLTKLCLLQIVVGRAHTVDGQMDLLMTVGAKMVEEPYKLLVVDSIMALFR